MPCRRSAPFLPTSKVSSDLFHFFGLDSSTEAGGAKAAAFFLRAHVSLILARVFSECFFPVQRPALVALIFARVSAVAGFRFFCASLILSRVAAEHFLPLRVAYSFALVSTETPAQYACIETLSFARLSGDFDRPLTASNAALVFSETFRPNILASAFGGAFFPFLFALIFARVSAVCVRPV